MIAEKSKTMQSYEDLAVTCSGLARLQLAMNNHERQNYIEEYYELSKMLLASADIPKYRKYIEEAERLMKTISL